VSSRISQQQLESHLWGAATLLRGTIDAGDYKQFIFPLLFYKRVCDVFDEETQAALKESRGDADFAAYPENHRFQIPQDAHWTKVRHASTNVGRVIQMGMRAIETANPEKLYGIFGDAQWTNKDRLSDSMLRDLVEHFSTLELNLANLPEDELGQGYEYLIKKFADDAGHTAAEFYTNRTVVHLMTEMLQPQPGESIYDPTCGSGGMLLSCITHLRRQNKEWRNVRLYGQERNLMTSSIARMNCFLHGIEDFRIERGDTLSEPKFVEGDRLMRFDVVLANPPYSIKQWDRDAFASDPWGRNLYGTPPQGRADYAFWQHILCSLALKTGRCAILFPHGVLFRQEESEMRRKLIEADLIECVVGLGPNLFYNSPMEACVVICRTAKQRGRKGRILLINAVNEVTRERSQSFLTDDHIRRIVAAYETFKDQPEFARVVSVDEIRKESWSINIPLYIVNAEHRRTEIRTAHDPLESVFAAWCDGARALRQSLGDVLGDRSANGRRLDVETQTIVMPSWLDRSKWQRVSFDRMAENVRETGQPKPEDSARYVGLEHMDSGSLHVRRWGSEADLKGQKLKMRKGDILFAKRNAYLRRVAIAPHDGFFSAHGMILRAKADVVLPEFLPFLMMSDRFMNRAVEISVGSLSPTINWTTLKLQEFEVPPFDQQRRIADTLGAGITIQVALEAVLESLARFSDASFYHVQGHTDAGVAALRGWRTVRLEQLCSHIVDCLHSTPSFVEEGYPVIRTADVIPGRMLVQQARRVSRQTYEERIGRLRPAAGDIFYSREGARFGIAASVPLGVDVCLGQRMMHFRASPEADSRYLLWLLNSPIVRRQAVANVIGSASPHVNIGEIRKFLVPCPPIHEQQTLGQLSAAISECEESIQQQIDAGRRLVSNLANRFMNWERVE
jgi:type I restriction enzyme M protein